MFVGPQGQSSLLGFAVVPWEPTCPDEFSYPANATSVASAASDTVTDTGSLETEAFPSETVTRNEYVPGPQSVAAVEAAPPSASAYGAGWSPTASQAYVSVCPSASVATAESVTAAVVREIVTAASEAAADVMTGGVLATHCATSVVSAVTGVAKSNATPSLNHPVIR